MSLGVKEMDSLQGGAQRALPRKTKMEGQEGGRALDFGMYFLIEVPRPNLGGF